MGTYSPYMHPECSHAVASVKRDRVKQKDWCREEVMEDPRNTGIYFKCMNLRYIYRAESTWSEEKEGLGMHAISYYAMQVCML